jgi:hydroxymethylpyrimidine pyrophosphatase-like HAD family hydrolase
MVKFYLIDLDDTIVNNRTKNIFNGVLDILIKLKSENNYLCICSHNINAIDILNKLNISYLFDFIHCNIESYGKIKDVKICINKYKEIYKILLGVNNISRISFYPKTYL